MAIPAEKVFEKVLEKRRALGRGLESLLPGPRVVPSNDPALAQSTRKDGAPSGAVETRAAEIPSAEGAGAVEGNGRVKDPSPHPSLNETVDLQASAARRSPDGAQTLELAIESVEGNPHQTRMDFDDELLKELARSIQVQGVIQPIVVRPGIDGKYVLILGERRLRASKLAGKTTIPAIVKRVSEQQAAEMTIVENLQRQDLDCLEQAGAFAHLSTEFGLTQEEIGKRVGASRETVSNYLRLLKLPEDVQFLLSRGDISYSHARELLVLEDQSQVSKLAALVVAKKMSVLQLEDAVLDLNVPSGRPESERGPGGGARWVDPNVRAAQRSLETVLGMRVRIRDRKGKGKITIEYGTLEDFDRVVGMLKGSG
jgi:ParB family transcriptional regulator, chromosome partitioning protein